MDGLQRKLNANPRWKAFVHWLMVPSGQARPRWWVRVFVNPWVHRHGPGSVIRPMTRMDVLPFRVFELGRRSTIEDFATVNNGVGPVVIGERVRIGIGSVLIGPVTVGDDAMLAQHVVCSGLNHEYRDHRKAISDQPVLTDPITIGAEAWIGANAVITAGVTVGQHAVVAAGSVVTRDVPAFTVVAGNPARVVKRFDPETKSWQKREDPHVKRVS